MTTTVDCSECGTEIPGGADRCPQCGKPIPVLKGRATVVLWLGILGIWPLAVLAPVAWYVGRVELEAIDSGIHAETLRKRAALGRRLGMIGTIGWAIVLTVYAITSLIATDSILFEERFDGSSDHFAVESDRFIDLDVDQGSYRIRLKSDSGPQLVRSFFPRGFDGIRFEATVGQVEETNGDAFYGLGCWNTSSAYQLMVNQSGEFQILEVVSETTGERVSLHGPTASSALAPVGQTNRLRIDCVGGGVEPTIVTGWINDVAVASVSIPGGMDSFNAVGFAAWSASGELDLRVDDVIAAAERPVAPRTPVAAGTGVETACQESRQYVLESLQEMLDAMVVWESLDEFTSASELAQRSAMGDDVMDRLGRSTERAILTGCNLDDAAISDLEANNSVAEEFIAEMFGSETAAFLGDLGINFTYPGDWVENRSLSLVPEPAQAFGVTPELSSGNWMGIIFLPSELGVTEEVFLAEVLPDLEGRGFTITGPREIEVAGVRGLEFSVSGIPGERTGRLHRAELIVLFGDTGTYRLQAQYDEENRATVLDAWEAMLNALVLPEGS